MRLIAVFGALAALLYLSAQVSPFDALDRESVTADPPGGGLEAALVPSAIQQQGPPVAVVRLSQVLPAHPRWHELRELEQNMVSEYTRAGLVVPPESVPDLDATELYQSLQDEQDRLTKEYQKQLEVQEEARWAQVSEQIERKKAQLARELEAEIGKKRAEFTGELSERGSKLQQEYQVKVLSLRLKLELLGSGDSRSELTNQIEQIKSEAAYKIGALEKEYQARADDFRRQAEKRYAQKLKDYADQLLADTERELQAKRQELEAELAEHISALKGEGDEPSVSLAKAEPPRLAELAQQISELRGNILADVRKAGDACAFRAGLGTVILTDNEVFDGVDISQDVMREIAEEGSLLREAGKADNTQ